VAVTYDDLAGRWAVVTGGASGIGRACALALAETGCHTAILDLPAQSQAAEETIGLVTAMGRQATFLAADVTDVPSVRRAVAEMGQRQTPVSIWVNCAGRVIRKPALELTEADWDAVLDVNLRGSFFCAQAAAAAMQHTSGGSIVNISSIFGLLGGANRAAYASSKAGLVNLTRCLAVEWQPLGIRVNAVAPSFVRTPLTEQLLAGGLDVQNRTLGNELPEPGDVAATVCFLASQAARMITGQVLAVDGGWSAW
jgi:2-dehydro-3-deoxy-D-gluconate 5-dehydrogenase